MIESGKNYWPNIDYELVFDTYSSSSIMGILDLKSKMKVEDTTAAIFRGTWGAKFTYSQSRTLGSVVLFDVTSQTVIIEDPIVSGDTPNVWNWQPFHFDLDLEYNHEYEIRLQAHDAWSGQKVQVAWESVEVVFSEPYYRTLGHQGYHSWRTEYQEHVIYHYYLCKMYSYFKFGQGQIYDILRDHRPYGDGTATGWDSAYIHEFRSAPEHILEGDYWYTTNLPGTVGYTNSGFWEGDDEEIEVYTRNPEYLVGGTLYNVWTRYKVQFTGSVRVTLEAELGNEADILAYLSPPGYPVEILPLTYKDISHSQASWMEPLLSYIVADNQSVQTIQTEPISYTEAHSYYNVIIIGTYPYSLTIYTSLDINSRTDAQDFVSEKDSRFSDSISGIDEEALVPSSITFNKPVDAQTILDLVSDYDLDVSRFRFTAMSEDGLIRGQGTPVNESPIPIEEVMDFLEDAELIGFQSIDAVIPAKYLSSLVQEEIISVVDIAGYLAILNAGINLEDYYEVNWVSEDATWFMYDLFAP